MRAGAFKCLCGGGKVALPWQLLHEFVNDRRESLKAQYPTEDSFVENFTLSESDVQEFLAYVKAEGIEITDEDWTISGEAMKVRTRAFIGRNLFEPSTFYRIIGDLNETLLEAIAILRDGRFKKAKLAHKTF